MPSRRLQSARTALRTCSSLRASLDAAAAGAAAFGVDAAGAALFLAELGATAAAVEADVLRFLPPAAAPSLAPALAGLLTFFMLFMALALLWGRALRVNCRRPVAGQSGSVGCSLDEIPALLVDHIKRSGRILGAHVTYQILS